MKALIADGRVIQVAEAEFEVHPALEWRACGEEVAPGWTWDGADFAAPVPDAAAVPARRVISPLAFRRRLAASTRHAITLAAATALAAGDASLQMFLDDLSAAGRLDLDDPETIAGVDAMQAAGLIADVERAALLADGEASEAA